MAVSAVVVPAVVAGTGIAVSANAAHEQSIQAKNARSAAANRVRDLQVAQDAKDKQDANQAAMLAARRRQLQAANAVAGNTTLTGPQGTSLGDTSGGQAKTLLGA